MTQSSNPSDDPRLMYTFDCRGYWVARGFLSDNLIKRMLEGFKQLQFLQERWHPAQRRVSGIHLLEGPLKELAETLCGHQNTKRLIGYPHRLLESYALERGSGSLDLHGGASEFLAQSEGHDISARSWVKNGRIYALRVKVLVYLDDVIGQEDGRLAYVEGSHKSEFPFHRAFEGGRNDAADLVRMVDVHAGDAIWLNESLLHGAETKTSIKPRRLLAYTFGPSFMASWRDLGEQTLEATGYAAAETERSDSVDE